MGLPGHVSWRVTRYSRPCHQDPEAPRARNQPTQPGVHSLESTVKAVVAYARVNVFAFCAEPVPAPIAHREFTDVCICAFALAQL